MDTVQVGPRDIAAPGELIVNRHTERRIASKYGVNLGAEVAGETRPHYAPMTGRSMDNTLGGRLQFFARGGRSGGGDSGMKWSGGGQTTQFARALAGRFGLSLGSGYRSPAVNAAVGGSPTSDHMKGNVANPGAWDVPVNAYGPNAIAGDRLAAAAVRAGVNQVLWRVADHYDHVHLGFGGGGGSNVGGATGTTGADGGEAAPLRALLKLGKRTSDAGGAFGGIANRVLEAQRAGILKRANSAAARGGGGGGNLSTTGGGSAGANQALGHRMLKQFGFDESQWMPLKNLWMKESGWSHTVPNGGKPGDGYQGGRRAYGIPQALPGSKMSSAGEDWKTNPATQIKWGLGYIKGRYGNPAGAWAHSQANNWYAHGGRVATGGGCGVCGGAHATHAHGGRVSTTGGDVAWGGWHKKGGSMSFHKPTMIGVGDGGGSERVTVTPKGKESYGARNVTLEVHVTYKAQGDVRKAVKAELEGIARDMEGMD